jgi:hypothetical protein
MDNREFSKHTKTAQKKAYKFNIIDFILIFIIIAAVSFLAYIMLGNNIFTGGEKATIQYTIEISLIKNDFLTSARENLKKGVKIIDSVRTNELGIIQDVKITDAMSLTTDLETGVTKETLYPDHSKVVITVVAESKKEVINKNDAKFSVNGETIMVGISMHFRTPFLVSYGNCTSLLEIDKEGNVINEY